MKVDGRKKVVNGNGPVANERKRYDPISLILKDNQLLDSFYITPNMNVIQKSSKTNESHTS